LACAGARAWGSSTRSRGARCSAETRASRAPLTWQEAIGGSNRSEGLVGRVAELRTHAYDAFVKQINCVCGYVVKGEDDVRLWEKAQAHLRTDHPDLVGKVSREDILAQAEET
jgi:hypothetical protein